MTKVKLNLLIDTDMLLIVKKVSKVEYVILFIDMRQLKTNMMKDYDKNKDFDKNKESSHLKYWDVNSSYGWTMSQKLTCRCR